MKYVFLGMFLIMFAAKIFSAANLSWLVVFSPLLLWSGFVVLFAIIALAAAR